METCWSSAWNYVW